MKRRDVYFFMALASAAIITGRRLIKDALINFGVDLYAPVIEDIIMIALHY